MPLKYLLLVSYEMSETPAPVSNSIRSEFPFNSTGISTHVLSVLRLYIAIENGSTESEGVQTVENLAAPPYESSEVCFCKHL